MSGRPVFSVIVPTRDRASKLGECLDSLAALDFPRDDYEVIVVDDGGRDRVDDVVGERSRSMHVALTRISHAGPGAARNAGVASSRGKLLAFIDDDCAAHPRWLREMKTQLAINRGAAVGGRVVNMLPSNRYARASQCLQDYVYRWYHDERRGDLRFFTTNNLAVSRNDFDGIGSFDESFPFASEDREWCDRALFHDFGLVYAPDAVVYHANTLGFGSFLTQHYRYGKGAARFHAVRATRRSNKVRLEPVEFYRGMLSAPFDAGEPAPAIAALLLVASQTASFIGFARELAGAGRSAAAAEHSVQRARNSHPAAPPKPGPVSGVISGS